MVETKDKFLEHIKDTFIIGYECFEESRLEAMEIRDLYHNRQYTPAQLAELFDRGQPPETFNVIKMFSRMFIGYTSSVVNTIKVEPRTPDDVVPASVLNDLVTYTLDQNNFASESVRIKLDGILSGLMCCYETVRNTGEVDMFGREIYEINLTHIPSNEIILDPMSQRSDYSDAKFIHRFKWISKEDLKENFDAKKVEELEAYYNYTELVEADFSYKYNQEFMGRFKRYDNYLVVHTIIREGKKVWSVFWSDNTVLSKVEITHKKVKFPYRVQKLTETDRAEYYGLFKDIKESQNAINQAIIRIQLLVNSSKAFVEEGAVKNMEKFRVAFERVNGIIPVKSLNGVRIDNLSKEVADQYLIVDKALERIKAVLCINDSFLGQAMASDSGKKVQIQQNASIVALKYLTDAIENFYRLLGGDLVSLIQQYYTATQVVAVTDSDMSRRFVQINQPAVFDITNLAGDVVARRYMFREVTDENGDPVKDDSGKILIEPIPYRESEIKFTKTEIKVESVAYNDQLEQNQAILDSVVNGTIGQVLLQFNPAGYLDLSAEAIRNTKTRAAPRIVEIINNTADMIRQSQAQQPQQDQLQQG